MFPADHFIVTGSFKPDCLHINVIVLTAKTVAISRPTNMDKNHLLTAETFLWKNIFSPEVDKLK